MTTLGSIRECRTGNLKKRKSVVFKPRNTVMLERVVLITVDYTVIHPYVYSYKYRV